MTNTRHTPGPWSAHYNNEGLTVFSPDNVTVAYVDYDECEERPVEANAHLIAAAPAMYEALSRLRNVASTASNHMRLSGNEEEALLFDNDQRVVEDALAQAEGKP